MKVTRKKRITMVVTFVLVAGLVFWALVALKPPTVQEANAKQLKEAIQNCETGDVRLSVLTTFEWDEVYTFVPYASEDTMLATLGIQWNGLHETVNEGMNQAVFIKNGEVVCYVYGYGKKCGYTLDFGNFTGNFLKLSRNADPVFHLEAGKQPILTYLGE